MQYGRWLELMAAFAVESNQETYSAIVSAYQEKHRHYHTSNHIIALLEHFDKVADLSSNSRELELANWFHDVIYKPLSSTNEKESSDWACRIIWLLMMMPEFLIESSPLATI